MFSKKSIIIMSIIIGVLVIFIASLFIWRYYPSHPAVVNNQPAQNNNASTTPALAIEAGKKATVNLISGIEQNAAKPGSPSQIVTVNRIVDGKTVSEQAVSVAGGTSPISVATGEVIAQSGEAAQNTTLQGMPEAPSQSIAVDPAALPADTIKLSVNSNNSITPNSFTVHPGQAVSLAMIDNAAMGEVIKFDDPSLAAIIFSLLPGMTRTMTFSAPVKIGEYVFASDISSQRTGGMLGKMIVK